MFSAIKDFFTRKWTFSDYFLVIGIIVASMVLFATDPGAGLIQLTFGADIVSKMSAIPATIYGVAALWISRKALFDYLNLKQLATRANESSIGAAILHLSVAVTTVALALTIIGLIGYFK